MKRDVWDVLMKLLAREGRMVAMNELLAGSELPLPDPCRSRSRLQSIIGELRRQVGHECGVEIKHDGKDGHRGTAYGLFDTLALRGKSHG